MDCLHVSSLANTKETRTGPSQQKRIDPLEIVTTQTQSITQHRKMPSEMTLWQACP